MDDESDIDLAIAQTDAKAAKQTLSQKNGLEKQHNRSISRLNERIIVMVVFFGLIAVSVVWLSEVPDYVRYGTLALVILLAITPSVLAIRKRLRLLESREKQLETVATAKGKPSRIQFEALQKENAQLRARVAEMEAALDGIQTLGRKIHDSVTSKSTSQ